MILTSVTYRRADGSFVGVVNGYPYHITASDPLYAAAQSAGAAAPFEPAPEAPPVTVPDSVPKVALVRALRQVGLDGNPSNPVKAWTVVKGALAQASEEVQEDWELSTRIPRSYQAITDIAAALNVPSPVLDAVFILARQIDVAG
jgi:hypothetical protein